VTPSDDSTAPETATSALSGLLLNPLTPVADPYKERQLTRALVAHAMAGRLLTAVRRSAATDDSKPIWIEKHADVSPEYHLGALADSTKFASRPGDSDVLLAYVPMSYMRAGRVRAALAALSERLVGGAGFPRVLGGLVTAALNEPDTELPEWAALDPDDVAAYLERLGENAVVAVQETYGPHIVERQGAEDLEILMRLSGARMQLLDGDPDAGEETVETDSGTESLVEAFDAAHIDPVEAGFPSADANESLPAGADEEARQKALNFANYVEAYSRANLSPVVARALVAYRTRGHAAATQELKVTKAPRKTLGAVAKLARFGWPAAVIMFDQFTGWENVPADLRLSIASALTEMRWAMAGSACVAFAGVAGETPEIEEQFAAAMRVEWDSPGIPEGFGTETSPEELQLGILFEAWTLGEPAIKADDPVLALAIEHAAGSLPDFCRIAGFAVDEAMAAGSTTLDAGSLDRAPARPEPEVDDEDAGNGKDL
jgi:hypothetical protein